MECASPRRVESLARGGFGRNAIGSETPSFPQRPCHRFSEAIYRLIFALRFRIKNIRIYIIPNPSLVYVFFVLEVTGWSQRIIKCQSGCQCGCQRGTLQVVNCHCSEVPTAVAVTGSGTASGPNLKSFEGCEELSEMRIPWYFVVNKSLNYETLGVVHRWNEIESSLISIWRSKRARSKIHIPSQRTQLLRQRP